MVKVESLCKSIEVIVESFPNVEEILIHHTNVQSLEGIEKLKNLRTFRIDYGRNLQSVKDVNECEHIEKSSGRTVLHTRFPG